MRNKIYFEECIICWKYNDLFYSLSNSKLNNINDRLIIVICLKKDKFSIPLDTYSNKIIFFEYDINSFFSLLKILIDIFFTLKTYQIQKVYLSNPLLIINQFIIKITKCREISLVEDGLMNYINVIPSKSMLKKTVQTLLGISNNLVIKKIDKTLLLAPLKSYFYFGDKEILKIKKFNVANNLVEEIQGKRIFIGTPIYKFGKITVNQYNKLINNIIIDYNIDYYVPHLSSSIDEKVNTKILNISDSNCTFEVIAPLVNVSVYSLGSSISYTMKLINPTIYSCVFQTEFVNFSNAKILLETVDQIVKIPHNVLFD